MYYFESYRHDYEQPLEIDFITCGYEVCIPGNKVYTKPDYYVMEFVVDGQGTYTPEDMTYKIKKGQGFMLRPHKDCTFMPDIKKPWTYYWIGIRTPHWERLTEHVFNLSPYTFTYNKSALDKVKEIYELRLSPISLATKNMKFLSLLYDLFYDLNEDREMKNADENPQVKYLQRAISYIAGHYRSPITVQEIADHLHIDRTYLFTIFKTQLHTSPSKYLSEFRLKKAYDLLKNFHLSAKDIALSVGFTDYSLFSRNFKKYYGITPSSLKAEFQEEN